MCPQVIYLNELLCVTRSHASSAQVAIVELTVTFIYIPHYNTLLRGNSLLAILARGAKPPVNSLREFTNELEQLVLKHMIYQTSLCQ